jgi:hypothetical protein
MLKKIMAVAGAFAVLALACNFSITSINAKGAGAGSGQGTATRTRTTAAPTEKPIIWRDPGVVEKINLAWGKGGSNAVPKPPFTFVEEDSSGTNPKIEVKDARGIHWGVKWAEEVNSEVFASRIVEAVGYFVEPAYYVDRGKILNIPKLDRAKKFVAEDGSFTVARFELRDKSIKKLGDEQSWGWENNPFVGTKELNGLKIMLMLLSNWDSKDQRDASRGSNTKLFYVNKGTVLERQYVVSDWGGTMGKWGNYFSRAKWDCSGFRGQNDDFVKEVKDGLVKFGYSGQHTNSIKDGIRVSDVKWLMGYLGRITDTQLHYALKASGAGPADEACFAAAVRARINRLKVIQ